MVGSAGVPMHLFDLRWIYEKNSYDAWIGLIGLQRDIQCVQGNLSTYF